MSVTLSVPMTMDIGDYVLEIKNSMPTLSLGDRLCLALSDRRDDLVLTADRAWGKSDRIVQIR